MGKESKSVVVSGTIIGNHPAVELDVSSTATLLRHRTEPEKRGMPWKLNSQQVADFYLLNAIKSFIPSPGTASDDTQNLRSLKLESQLGHVVEELGDKIVFASLRLGYDEFLQWSHINPSAVEKIDSSLKLRILTRYDQAQTANRVAKQIPTKPYETLVDAITYHLGEVRKLVESSSAHEYKETVHLLKVREAKGDTFLSDTLQLFESIQEYREWADLAKNIRHFLYPDNPLNSYERDLMKHLSKSELERKCLLLDIILNSAHKSGYMYQKFSNDVAEMATVFVSNRLDQRTSVKMLSRYASTVVSSLAKQILPTDNFFELAPDEVRQFIYFLDNGGRNWSLRDKIAVLRGVANDENLVEAILENVEDIRDQIRRNQGIKNIAA